MIEMLFGYWRNRVTSLQVLVFLHKQFHQKRSNFFSSLFWMTLFEIETMKKNSGRILPNTVIWYFITILVNIHWIWNSLKDLRNATFIDLLESSLKTVLLRNGNMCPSVPLAHATNLKENYLNMKLWLEKVEVVVMLTRLHTV